MSSIRKTMRLWDALFIFFLFSVFACWAIALWGVGPDVDQGEVYRILYLHVPVAWCAFVWIFWGAWCAARVLFTKDPLVREVWDRRSYSAIELGTLFSFLVLVTGSIWGRPTWGVWWDWDPRLTSSLVMFLSPADIWFAVA